MTGRHGKDITGCVSLGGQVKLGSPAVTKPAEYSLDEREQAVRMGLEHEPEYSSQWAAIQCLARKIGWLI